MDHLFHIDRSILVHVPLYADIDNLLGNKNEASWDKGRLKNYGDLQGHSEDEVAQLFQSWLYFRFLHRFFEGLPAFSLLDFITQDENGKHNITTSKLQHWLIEWFVWTTNIYTVQYVQRSYYQTLNTLFAEVHDAATLFCTVGRSAPYKGPIYPGVPEDLSLSIIVLFAALEKAATQLTGLRFHFDLGNSRLLVRLLHKKNWCPTDVEWLSLRNIDTLYTAYTMDRPNPVVQHLSCQPWKCEAFYVADERNYEQAHVIGCSDCPSRGVPLEKLKALIENDQIPVLTFTEPDEEMQVVGVFFDSRSSQGEEIQFAALSHVWSDGLGNPVANSLPLCQLRRLQQIMNEALTATPPISRTNVLWWCDTLCVPARGTDDECRKRAIQDMRHVYKAAHKVLVLDSFLANQDRDVSAIRAYFNLLISRWMRRLWTFHEAVLAQDILIQFKEGPASLANLYYTMLNSKSSSLLCTWYDNDCIEALKPFVEGLAMEQDFLIAIYRAVAIRSTSRQADETICLANVQGINVKSILDIDEKDTDGRMIQYLRLVRHLPAVLLFQRLPRLSKKGFRWTPTSLLARFRQAPTSFIYTDHPNLTIDEAGDGVSALLPGITLNAQCRDALAAGHHFGLILADTAGSEAHFIIYYAPGEASGEKQYPHELSRINAPGLVLCYSPWSGRFETFDRAMLVNVVTAEESEDARRFVADNISLVGVRRVPETVFEGQAKKSENFTVWRGTYYNESTTWLIS